MIVLDHKKLLGFRIATAARSGKSGVKTAVGAGAKIGQKSGVKTAINAGVRIGSKSGAKGAAPNFVGR